MLVRGNFSQLLAPAASSVMDQDMDLEQRDLEFPNFMNMETTDRAYDDEFEITGLPPMGAKDEGDNVKYDEIIEGGSYRFMSSTYAQGVRASFELVQDDQYGKIKKIPSLFARTSRHTQEQFAANVLNNGFTTQLSIDGLSLFNTAHPLLGGFSATAAVPTGILGSGTYVQGTYPNRPGVDIDLSYSGIQLMINQCERMIDDRGILIKAVMKQIVHPPELRWVAEEIFNPVDGNKPYTADKTPNVVANKGLTPLMLHYLTSVSAWFGLADKRSHKLKHFTRQALEQAFSDDFDTRSVKWIAFYRDTNGASHWRGSWGSNGP